MANKPKITGLGFNLFAILAVFVLLPIATAFITTLSNANAEDFESITTEYATEMQYDPLICGQPFGGQGQLGYDDVYSLTWQDKGANSTADYMNRDNTTYVERYESLYDPSSGSKFHQMSDYCGLGNYLARDNDLYTVGVDNHRWLNDPHYLYGANPNYTGYIGYSGDEFSFRVNSNQMKWLDNSKDISAFKLSFIDYQTAFDCDNPIFQSVSSVGDITLGEGASPYGTFLDYENFEFEEVNYFKVGYAPNYASGLNILNLNDFCHIGLEFEFDFSPIESIEISETFNKNYEDMHLRVTLRDFEFDNLTALNITAGSSNAPIPFTGDDNFGFNFKVAYVDTVRVNFWLNGGTLFMGAGLFGLAISNTPYWNPVVNFFKEKRA